MAPERERALVLALAGGGTGGHVVPGLHLLAHFAQRPGALARVLWFLSGRAVEECLLAGIERILGGVPLERVPLALEPEGGGAPSLSRLALCTPGALRRARSHLRSSGAEVLLGLGGFTTLPPVLAARTLGVPVALLEINAERGRATRWLTPLCARVLHAWPLSLPGGRASARHACIGPPLAPAFLRGVPEAHEELAQRARLGFEERRPLLVVLGGSQGAAGLNRFVVPHVPAWLAAGLQVLHQVGPGRRAEGAPERPGYRCVEYVDDVRAALAAATLVLCRGGASTLAEVGVSGRPAFVVPYPHHADRHQEKNARCLGAGVLVIDERRLGEEVAREICALAGPSGAPRRSEMARALATAVPREGARRLADELLALAARGRESPRGRWSSTRRFP
jgi:UDP-N-acetylglucosamine:LPS N-acetylglucosamine transferase